ncbi:AC3_0185 family rSAM-modified Cys-rich RiPP [Desulfosporosinus metallidurans]
MKHLFSKKASTNDVQGYMCLDCTGCCISGCANVCIGTCSNFCSKYVF